MKPDLNQKVFNMSLSKSLRYSSRNADKFVIRFPPGMLQRLVDVAVQHRRSANAQVVFALQQRLRFEGKLILESDLRLDSTDLTKDELMLLQCFRKLCGPQQKALVMYMSEDNHTPY
jgi:hypothetical protein